MSTMDLGLTALVADSNDSVVPALAGLALAGVALAVIRNLRGEEIDLKDLPVFRLGGRYATWVHPEFIQSERATLHVDVLSPEERAIYRDWLLDPTLRPPLIEMSEPEAQESGAILALQESDEPFIEIDDGGGFEPDSITCRNIDIILPTVRRGVRLPRAHVEECLEFVRQALAAGGQDATSLVPPHTQLVPEPRWPLHMHRRGAGLPSRTPRIAVERAGNPARASDGAWLPADVSVSVLRDGIIGEVEVVDTPLYERTREDEWDL